MKLKKIEINHFKGLKHFVMDLTEYGGKPRFFTCIVGDNGSGKTTVLQAIALVLSLATRKISSLNNFHWNGLIPTNTFTDSTSIMLELEMDEDERLAINELLEKFNATVPTEVDKIQSVDLKNLTILYQPGSVKCLENSNALKQLQGRFYLKKLLLTEQFTDLAQYFSKVGDVFWFDQYRNLGNTMPDNFAELSWKNGIASIRDTLSRWWIYHNLEEEDKIGTRDYLVELEQKISVIFPGTQLIGVKPIKKVINDHFSEESLFLLRRNGIRYDIAEMSSGEQTIFNLLYQFVSLEIARSIILIDELELHLHPPQQQAIYAYLRKLSPDSQFIFTTHSPYLEDILPAHRIVRMEENT